jgi:uncharacterized protein YaaW (UPF0174 family)
MKNPVVDKDLTQLLRHCDNDELEPIVTMILSAPSQTLTMQPGYKEHQGDHKAYIDEIVYEITSFGGNSIANLTRGHGVPYGEMVQAVAKKLGVKPGATDTTPLLEEKILLKVLRLSYDKLSEDDRVALQGLLFGAQNGNGDGGVIGNGIAPEDSTAGSLPSNELLAGLSEEDFSRRLATASTSLLGDRLQHAIDIASRSVQMRQVLTSIMKAAVAKIATVGVGGPLSWAVAAGQAIYDLFGPNYTFALGLVAQIGLLRQKHVQIQRDQALPEVETAY